MNQYVSLCSAEENVCIYRNSNAYCEYKLMFILLILNITRSINWFDCVAFIHVVICTYATHVLFLFFSVFLRLSKILSLSSVVSRNKAQELIRSGNVKVKLAYLYLCLQYYIYFFDISLTYYFVCH